MASKVKFVSDFRQAVADLLAASQRVQTLAATAANMGWTAESFAAILTDPDDVTADEFVAALAAVKGPIATQIDASRAIFAKLGQ